MTKKKKIIIGLVALGVIVAAAAIYFIVGSTAKAATPVQTTDLAKGTLQRTVSAEGSIVSAFTEQVSNTSNIPVWDVDVAVGNYVSKGDRLCRLYNKESDTWESVYATASGTITSVDAINGAPAAGVLFTIQDTGNLKVKVKIKESDIGQVTTGMKANIKTDATGDRVYVGTIESIAPTASAQASGTTSQSQSQSTAKPEFDAMVPIDSPADGLYIGMKTKQEIVVEEKGESYSLPFDAITKDDQGNPQIMVVRTDDAGKMTAEALPVTTGIQTDIAVEITGEGLSDGLKVITNPTGITSGMEVTTEAPANGQTDAPANKAV